MAPNPGGFFGRVGTAAEGVIGRGVATGINAAGGFDVDTKSIEKLVKALTGVTSALSAIDTKIKQINADLTTTNARASSFARALGAGSPTAMMSAGTAAAGGLTVANVSVPGAGTVPSETGPGGPNNRTAGFSAGVGLLAGGEIAGSLAGRVNTSIAGFSGGGSAIDVMARQAGGVFGVPNTTAAQTKNTMGFYGISNTGISNLGQAVAALQANPLLFGTGTGAKANQLKGFLNNLQRLNPSLGAAGAAQFANAITSGPALTALQRYTGGGALINPKTLGINSTTQTMNALVTALMGGQRLTSAGMRSSMQGTQGVRNRTLMQQNVSIGAMSGLGLTPQDLEMIEQYMAGGGVIPGAQSAMGRSVATAQLRAATTQTGRQGKQFESSQAVLVKQAQIQEAANKAFSELPPAIQSIISGLGVFTSAALGAAKAIGDLGGLAYILKGRGSRVAPVAPTTEDAAATAVGGGAVATGVAETVGAKALSLFEGGGLAALYIAGHQGKKPLGQMTGKELGLKGDPTGETTTTGMKPGMASRVNAMRRANPQLKINSGHRSRSQQSLLFALKGGHQVAAPGHSAHEHGTAADLGPPSQFGWIARNSRKFGLGVGKGEPWHVQMGDPEPPGWNPDPGPTHMPSTWPQQVLRGLGVPASAAAVQFMKDTAQGEHGGWQNWASGMGALNNPTDTVAPPGFSPFNWNGGNPVQNYRTPQQGISSTVRFFQGSFYSQLVNTMKTGKASLKQLANAHAPGQWWWPSSYFGLSASPGVAQSGQTGIGGGGAGAAPPLSSGGATSSLMSDLLRAYSRGIETPVSQGLSNTFLAQVSGAPGGGASGAGPINSRVAAAIRNLGKGEQNTSLAMAMGALLQSGSDADSFQAQDLAKGLYHNMGDPTSTFAAPSAGISGYVGGGSGGGIIVNLSMPIQMLGSTGTADAQRLVHMVVVALKGSKELQELGAH